MINILPSRIIFKMLQMVNGLYAMLFSSNYSNYLTHLLDITNTHPCCDGAQHLEPVVLQRGHGSNPAPSSKRTTCGFTAHPSSFRCKTLCGHYSTATALSTHNVPLSDRFIFLNLTYQFIKPKLCTWSIISPFFLCHK